MPCLAHQVAEGGQRGQLPGREQVRVVRHPVALHPEAERGRGQLRIRHALRPWNLRCLLVLGRRRQVHPPPVPLRCHGHQLRAHPPGLAFGPHVGQRHRRRAGDAHRTGAADGAVLAFPRCTRDVMADAEAHPAHPVDRLDGRHHVGLLALLLAQPPRAHQRHLDPARRVGAGHSARPDPGDHVGLRAVRQRRLRVQVPDPPLRLVAHPGAVAAHILGQAGGARPVTQAFLGRTWEHRRSPGPLGRNLDQRLVDQHRHRVEVRGMRLQPQPLGFQRDRTAARERVENGRRLAVAGGDDLGMGGGQQLLVAGVLPHHQPLDQVEQPAPLGGLLGLGGELLRVRRRVVHQLRKQHRPARGERPAGPPQVQRCRVPVADRLLPRGLPVDRLQRQRDLDQLALRRRHLVPSCVVPNSRSGSLPASPTLPRYTTFP